MTSEPPLSPLGEMLLEGLRPLGAPLGYDNPRRGSAFKNALAEEEQAELDCFQPADDDADAGPEDTHDGALPRPKKAQRQSRSDVFASLAGEPAEGEQDDVEEDLAMPQFPFFGKPAGLL
ncbi:MAG: hypothetical protein IMZ44_05615 [Planctomycetes bacterium]|nr:hypothetical protein [Planctomycetota bacterium]